MNYDEANEIIACLRGDIKKHDKAIKENLERIQELKSMRKEESQFDTFVIEPEREYYTVDLTYHTVKQMGFTNGYLDKYPDLLILLRQTEKAAEKDLALLVLTTKFKEYMQLWSEGAKREYALTELYNGNFTIIHKTTAPYWLRGSEEAIQKALKTFSNSELKAIFTQTWIKNDE